MMYHKDGQHKLYAESKGIGLEKAAGYPIDLIGGFYSEDDKKSYNFESSADDARKNADLKVKYKLWKKKLNSALRRIDRLLRDSEDYCTPDVYKDIAGQLHALDMKVNQMRLASTAADLTFSAANGLRKAGFEKQAGILYKIAQEAPVEPEVSTDDTEPSAEDLLAETEPIPVSEIDPIPGAAPGEYDDLAGDTSTWPSAEEMATLVKAVGEYERSSRRCPLCEVQEPPTVARRHAAYHPSPKPHVPRSAGVRAEGPKRVWVGRLSGWGSSDLYQTPLKAISAFWSRPPDGY